jgi:hypothetical protein
MPVQAGWAEGGEVAPVDPSAETGRDEGVATPDGTEAVTGAGTGAVRLGRNSVNQSRKFLYELSKECCVLFFFFFF